MRTKKKNGNIYFWSKDETNNRPLARKNDEVILRDNSHYKVKSRTEYEELVQKEQVKEFLGREWRLPLGNTVQESPQFF